MVSHDEDLTNKYADRIIKMKDGKVICDKYQTRNKHKEYLPVLKLRYDDKRRTLPFNFLFNHTISSIKRRKWRTSFITLSTSLGLIGIGLASALSEIVSTNLYRSYSSILDSDKIVVSLKNPNINKDIITSATLNEVNVFRKNNTNIKDIGAYYWNTNDIFLSNDFLSLDSDGVKKPFGNYGAKTVNEFALLSSNKSDIYPKKVTHLENNEIILSMPMLLVSELCYQLQISRTIDSLSTYIKHHEVNMQLNFSNDSWGYSAEIPLTLKGFILSTKNLIYHSNNLWNEFIFEKCCLLPTTEYINVNTGHPWDLKKSYYMDFPTKRDDFLMDNRFSLEIGDIDFELMDEKYYPLLLQGEESNNCTRLLVVHRSNKDDIPSYVGNYCKKTSDYVYDITYGSQAGYSIYEQSLMMGFSKSTLLSQSEEHIYDMIDSLTYIKYEDTLSITMPKEIVEGHFSKSNSNGFVFEPHYSLVNGREPANFQEILISETLMKRLNITNPINKMIFLSFPVKEDLLANGYLSREYKTVALKIVGLTNSGKVAISHKETWSILFFQTMLGISTFDLRINNLAIRIQEGKEDLIIDKITRAFPNLVASAPLKEIKSSVDTICGYIEIIMLAVSIASVVIASLILFICNYLHFMEIKKDIGLVRCLGVKEKESRKFVFMHSFIMTGISFILSSVELIVISIFLSKALSESLFIDSVFVFNPLSLVYMFGVAFLISIVSSLFISRKISKLDALECLQ